MDVKDSSEYTINVEELRLIFFELKRTLSTITNENINFLVEEIIKHKRIFLVAAGRVGLMLQSFAMRLCQLGFSAYFVEWYDCPPIEQADIMIVASSSGETPTVREIVIIANKIDAEIILITTKPHSTIAKASKNIILLNAPSSLYLTAKDYLYSKQPMKTLFEQSIFILMDSVILRLMSKMGISNNDMARKHTNLE